MENTQKGKAGKIVSIVLNSLFYAIIALVLLFSISNLSVKDNVSIPSLFGRGYLTVLTDSMDGNKKESFTTNDLIFVKKVSEKNNEKLTSELEVDDIITFQYFVEELKSIQLVTHRIVHKEMIDGELWFVTQGDKVLVDDAHKYNPENPSSIDDAYYQRIKASSVVAIYTGKAAGLGSAIKFLTSQVGFLVCIVLPCAAFCIYRLIVLAIGILKMKQAKFLEENANAVNGDIDLEAERERIRAELLAEMEKENKDSKTE